MTLARPSVSRWTLLAVAAGAMGVAGTYQFVWSSVRVPLGSRLGIPEAGLGTVFTLFVVAQTLSQFPAGWVRDRYGPRIPMLAGAVMLASGYAVLATATAPPMAYVGYVVGGSGNGFAFSVAMNTGVKWFDDRRGFATGAVGMAYGGVSFLVIPAVRGGIESEFRATLAGLGALAGGVALAAAWILRDPDDAGGVPAEVGDTDGGTDAGPDAVDPETGPDAGDPETGPEADDRRVGDGGTEADPDGGGPTSWREVVRTHQFWLLYAAFVVVNGVGLMVIGKVVAYAEALELSAATATAGASFVAVADASGILAVGTVSDRLGRERTSAATLVLSGLALSGAVAAGTRGVGPVFIALVAVTAFFRSPVFAVFPSIVGDYYGEARSSENFAVLYTAKLWGGVFGGVVASRLVVTLGWSESFLIGGVLMTLAGLSLVALRPP